MAEFFDQFFVNLKVWIMDVVGMMVPPTIQPYLSTILNVLVILSLLPLIMMYLTWLERKVIARIQDRVGPNRVGWFGLLQPLADGVKMVLKEDIVPAEADKLLHWISPVAVVALSMMLYLIMPFGRNMAAVDLNVGILFFMAISSVEAIPVFIAGWASRNKFSVIGAMRAVAQVISYEIPLGLSLIVVVMAVGSLSLTDIVVAQSGWGGMHWHVFTPWGLLAFILFFMAGIAEVNRTPFDTLEAESEVVAGFHTEYTGMKFALFQMAEFLSAFFICGLSTTLFLGGWNGPFAFIPSWVWFFSKTYLLFIVMIWLRGTFPRLRIDQLMNFAWKFMIPMTLTNIVAAALCLSEKLPPVISWPIATAMLVAAWMFFSTRELSATRPPVSATIPA